MKIQKISDNSALFFLKNKPNISKIDFESELKGNPQK